MTAVPEGLMVTEPGLVPGSPEWIRRVSPSKAAAMLTDENGRTLSHYDSQYAMWRKMRGEVPWDEENEAMERGTLCEPAVLAWWRKHHDHREWREQVTITLGDWCVATPDAICRRDNGDVEIVEAKTAANMDQWGEPGTNDVPIDYLVQVLLAMQVARLNGVDVKRANIPVLGGRRLLFTNYVVEYDADDGAAILAACREFYDSLGADVPPPLDDTVATFDAVRKVHPDIERGAEVELTREAAVELAEACAGLDAAKARDRLARSTVIEAMGRAQFAKHQGIKVARRQPRGEAVSFVPTAKPSNFVIEGIAS